MSSFGENIQSFSKRGKQGLKRGTGMIVERANVNVADNTVQARIQTMHAHCTAFVLINGTNHANHSTVARPPKRLANINIWWYVATQEKASLSKTAAYTCTPEELHIVWGEPTRRATKKGHPSRRKFDNWLSTLKK